MEDELGVSDTQEEISKEVVRRLAEVDRERLPLIEGAVEAVERLAARWPLGLASSSNRELIDLVLELSGLARFFQVTVSSEEVQHGKPAPDVYLEAARGLGAPPENCAPAEAPRTAIPPPKAPGRRVTRVPTP